MNVAKLEIGMQIKGDSPYIEPWTDADRVALKEKVWANVEKKVPRGVWSYWENIPLSKSHLSEAEVQVEIDKALQAHAADESRTWDLRLNETVPEGVKYIWRNGERICIHSYPLQAAHKGTGDFTDWTVSHEGTDKILVTVTLMAEFMWASEA